MCSRRPADPRCRSAEGGARTPRGRRPTGTRRRRHSAAGAAVPRGPPPRSPPGRTPATSAGRGRGSAGASAGDVDLHRGRRGRPPRVAHDELEPVMAGREDHVERRAHPERAIPARPPRHLAGGERAPRLVDARAEQSERPGAQARGRASPKLGYGFLKDRRAPGPAREPRDHCPGERPPALQGSLRPPRLPVPSRRCAGR
jgi:hypothetical protein